MPVFQRVALRGWEEIGNTLATPDSFEPIQRGLGMLIIQLEKKKEETSPVGERREGKKQNHSDGDCAKRRWLW